jgi:hypothetical protein
MAKQPTHVVYHVRQSGQGSPAKGQWTKVGAAWVHKDGKGFDLVLELIPVGQPRLVLREPIEEVKAKK